MQPRREQRGCLKPSGGGTLCQCHHRPRHLRSCTIPSLSHTMQMQPTGVYGRHRPLLSPCWHVLTHPFGGLVQPKAQVLPACTRLSAAVHAWLACRSSLTKGCILLARQGTADGPASKAAPAAPALCIATSTAPCTTIPRPAPSSTWGARQRTRLRRWSLPPGLCQAAAIPQQQWRGVWQWL